MLRFPKLLNFYINLSSTRVNVLTSFVSKPMGNSEQLAIEFATSLSNLTFASTSLSDATTSLSSAATSFTSIVQKIEARFKDLAAWEADLIERKKILDELNTSLDEKEMKLKMKESQLMLEKNELREKMMEWEIKENKMKESICAVGDVVTLSVGGQQFKVPKQLLTKYNDSFFTTLVKSDHEKNNNDFYIDRDPKHFMTVVNYLREGKMIKNVKAKDISDIKSEFSFYGIPLPELEEYPEKAPKETTIFDPSGDLLTVEFKKIIRSWIPNSHLFLLYKGAKDGFEPHIYHEKCDARGPTLSVIMSSEGFLFGGYTLTTLAEAPGNAERPTLHPDSFLFTLTNPHTLPPTLFPLAVGNWPTLYTPFEHLHLGWGRWGYDLALSRFPNSDKRSYFGFPFAFKDRTGHGKLTFTGTEYFNIRDIEVFSVVPAYSNPLHTDS